MWRPIAVALVSILCLAAAAVAGDRLSPNEQAQLKTIARDSITTGLEKTAYHLPEHLPPELARPSGAFVTLKRQGALRGCIGLIVSDQPLAATVARMAREAAFHDPRFRPLDHSELAAISIEISVLSPPRRITDPATVVVGRDGLIVSRGLRTGLLLPQVATEFGWDRETFLSETCGKANLPANCWQDPDTIIEAFSAEVF